MARLVSTVLILAVQWPVLAQPLGYAVSGVVRDARRQPVRGARIEVLAPGFEGRFVISDRNGRYRIPDLAGGVQLRASRDGYSADVRGVAAGDVTVVDFVLRPCPRPARTSPSSRPPNPKVDKLICA